MIISNVFIIPDFTKCNLKVDEPSLTDLHGSCEHDIIQVDKCLSLINLCSLFFRLVQP